jgi:hypothetical protein
VLDADSILGFLQSLVGAAIDPRFDNNGGKPNIPVGSKQDVAIAIESSGTEHPKPDTQVEKLISQTRSLLPSDLIASPTFWYVATGYQNSDRFFQHAGAFSSIYVNKIFFPAAGPLTLNVEHSHDVDYVIQAQYQLISAGSGAAPSPVTQITGSLSGTDDIAISGTSLSSLVPFGFSYPVVITVQLKDTLTGAMTSGVFGYSGPDINPREP